MGIYRQICVILISFTAILIASPAYAVEKEKKPYPRYWMSVETNNMSMPGMQGEIADMSGLFGGFGQTKKSLYLKLVSPHKAFSEPQANHDIPEGMKMGKTLPLISPQKEKAVLDDTLEYEKPRLRMLIYWGCGEKVRQGQPRIIDTEKMTLEEFGKAMKSRGPSPQYPPAPRSGWIYSEWPNIKKREEVKKDSSLIGEHLVHGNYLPDAIKFKISEKHDFMAPVEFTSVKGNRSKGFQFAWKTIPTATGYFAAVNSNNEKTGEMIVWTSSEVYDTGWGLMDYLSNEDVKRFLKEKVIMPADATSCTVPAGIFNDASGLALQFIAYGSELNLVHPPMPENPKEKEKWNPIWTVKVRLKSTGMAMLDDIEQDTYPGRSKAEESDADVMQKNEDDGRVKEESNPLKKLRGIFGF